jgi:hypothetical protein
MIRIKDVYVSLNNIKKLYFEGHGEHYCYMFIEYQFDDNPVKIEVDNFDDYVMYAEEIAEAVK